MKNFIGHLGLTALLIALAIPVTLLAGPADTAVQVNGAALTERDVAQFSWMASGRQPSSAMERKQVIEEMTIQELWAQQAVKQGLDKNPDIQARLANARRTQLATAAIEHYQNEPPISDEQIRAAYQSLVEQHPAKEYKARHILLKTGDEAVAVIAELDKGADFAELAKQRSIGPSAARGGDLGWFTLATMVKPFSDAVASLKKGTYSREPIQTQFGWHVLLLEDYRDKQPPTFDQVKPRLQLMLTQEVLRDRLSQLKKEARIEVK